MAAGSTGRSLLAERDFLLVSVAVGLSAMGDWVAITALGLHVEGMTDNGYAVAALWICLFGPSVAVAGHAGLLVDRVEATRLLALVCGLGAVGAAALAFADARASVLILTAALGVVFALMRERILLSGYQRTTIDLGAIQQPLYAVGAEQDHIAPWKQTFRLCGLTGGPARYVLATSGHILGIINPPVTPPKRRYWVGPSSIGNPAFFQAGKPPAKR